ncbi:TPA: hypothetical protein KKW95_001782 [Legionella pneumophila]|nr:hypothetical protein [Legionella pneumophila]STY00330.1 Uncharacterised protein [Legionella pneumophila]HAT1775050.1 hypothetical protein [Legionella pneumophila]HAT1778393.1 hypothetical protein [Legionella pneumophila]HAT2018917.1 hypothetical protein [Legionella pneumophila]HAT2024701.1 hypothetical protein [Legionella pneumophila]
MMVSCHANEATGYRTNPYRKTKLMEGQQGTGSKFITPPVSMKIFQGAGR